jgi:hypothetical protein
MTKSEMKKLMKPLVKECLQEMLLEEGLLSNLVSEVMKGQQRSVVTENKMPIQKQVLPAPKPIQKKTQVNEVRRKLADSIGNGAYASVFEGLEPAPSPGDLGVDDGDPGMDLSMLSNIPGLKGFK